MAQVDIDCGTGDSAYTVSLFCKDSAAAKDVYTKSIDLERMGTRDVEERVTILLAIAAESIAKVERRNKDGELIDKPEIKQAAIAKAKPPVKEVIILQPQDERWVKAKPFKIK